MTLPPQLSIPEDVLEIVRTLESAGFEAWCVGGAIRDTILGESNTDHDIATAATPDQVRRLFPHTVAVGERYGTMGVRTRRRHHEVTTFRRDVNTDGRHPVVEYGVSLEDDLARRDFTVNAIAYHPLRHQWRDPFGGEGDLDRRILRAVGNPEERFREDYLRILRAVRFAARFDFTVAPDTWRAARASADGLRRLSAERVREEWFKGLRTAGSIQRLVQLWWEVGAAEVWIPELVRVTGGEAAGPAAPGEPLAFPTHPLVGGLEQRSAVLPALTGSRGAAMRRDPVLLTTLLCLDPVAVLGRLKASNAEITRAATVLTGPREPEGVAPRAVRRWLSAVGDAADDFSMLWELRHGIAPLWDPVVRGIRERGEPLSRKALAVTGADLQAAGIPPGPAMGAILDDLVAQVVDDPSLNTREALLGRARMLQ